MGKITSGIFFICLTFYSTGSQSSYSDYGYQAQVTPQQCDHTRMCTRPNEVCVETPQQGLACHCLPGYQWDGDVMDCRCIIGKYLSKCAECMPRAVILRSFLMFPILLLFSFFFCSITKYFKVYIDFRIWSLFCCNSWRRTLHPMFWGWTIDSEQLRESVLPEKLGYLKLIFLF